MRKVDSDPGAGIALAPVAFKEEVVDKGKLVFAVALNSMALLLNGCGRVGDAPHDLKGPFYPLDLALTCDESTPSPLRSDFPERDSGTAVGDVCIERNSGASALGITKIDIHRVEAFRAPVYEIWLHIDRKDQRRMEKAMGRAIRPRRFLAYMVHGQVVAQALVADIPKDGVIMMGGYDSVREAEMFGARFEVPTQPDP